MRQEGVCMSGLDAARLREIRRMQGDMIKIRRLVGVRISWLYRKLVCRFYSFTVFSCVGYIFRYDRQDMTESDVKFAVIPLHHRPDLIKDCCKLLNSEWPRSETARMKSLNVSCDNFPTCLVLINNENKVLGHCKISLVARSKVSCFIESVVIDYRCRSQGLGSRLLRGVEEYVAKRGLKNIYLKTDGQEVFYYKNGYKVCDPFKAYGINDIITASPPLGRTRFKERNGDQSAGQPPPPPPPPPMPAFQLSKFFDMRMLSQKTHMLGRATRTKHWILQILFLLLSCKVEYRTYFSNFI